MDAQVLNLGDIRLRRGIAHCVQRSFPMQTVLDSSALAMTATLFWVEYMRACLSFHAAILSIGSTPVSARPSERENGSSWL